MAIQIYSTIIIMSLARQIFTHSIIDKSHIIVVINK